LLAFLRFNLMFSEDTNRHALEHITYGNLVEITDVLQNELSLIGLGVNDPTVNIIVSADSTDLKFLADYDNDNVSETIRYYLGDPSTAASTDNPNDRMLFRQIDSNPPKIIGVGLTDFYFTYFDKLGNVTSNPADISVIEVNLVTESVTYAGKTYPKVAWHGKITPLNLYGK
ncbi:MAG: hypothetical protein D6800_14585, partial [Candidatus Zixiibacteriota bacterium]